MRTRSPLISRTAWLHRLGLLCLVNASLLLAQDPESKPVVADTQFSHDRGFYTEPIVVELSTATEGAEIFYTTNGAEPGNLFTGQRYDGGGLRLDRTTVLRAQASKPGHAPSNIDTHTYIFAADVIHQPDEPTGFATAWQGSDYGMDQDPAHLPLIAGDTALSPEAAQAVIAEALRALPTLSLVMEHRDLFGSSRGIYHHTQERGREWERPVSMELFDAKGTVNFQTDAGIRMQGFTSRNPSRNPKHSLRLVFREEYGATKLRYPLFGPAGASEFDTVVLRSNSQDAWVYDAASNRVGQFVRDEWARRTQLAFGKPAPRGTWVHLYLNGLYWGVYNPTERPDASFMESYFGGDKADYDILKNHEEVIDGNGEAYQAALALIQNHPRQFSQGYRDLTLDAEYEAAATYVDVSNLADYLIPNMYAAATDWPGNNYIGRDRSPHSTGFKFFSWDNEHGMKHSVNENRVLPHRRDEDSPTKFHHAFRANAEYRIQFADHLHRAFFNGGPLYVDARHPDWDPEHPERNRPAALWMELTSAIEEGLIAESARWGDYRRSTPYTVGRDFHELRKELLEDWFPRRSGIVLDQFRDLELYPNLHAPVFDPPERSVEAGTAITMNSKSVSVFLPGATIYYTLDGSDPRLPGGDVNPLAATYQAPVPLAQSRRLKARVENGGDWSALQEVHYLVDRVPASASNLLISAIHYHPVDPDASEQAAGFANGSDFEFLELMNPTASDLDLGGLRLAGGIRFDFEEGASQVLAAGARARLVRNREAYQHRFPNASPSILGEYRGKLANEGETLAIIAGLDEVMLTVTYDDDGEWPEAADGEGAFLVLAEPQIPVDLSDPGAWRATETQAPSDVWTAWLAQQPDPRPLAPYRGGPSSNLTAFYFGLDRRGETPALRVADRSSETCTLTFLRRLDLPATFEVEVQASPDLKDWQTVQPLAQSSTPVDAPGQAGLERVSFQCDAIAAPYFRLAVSVSSL